MASGEGGVRAAKSDALTLTCPNCQTRYKINPQALGPQGRRVRCSNCGHRWHVAAPPRTEPADRPAPEGIDPAPLPEPAAAEEARREPARKGATGAVIAWLALLLVALAVTGLIAGRNEILALYPNLSGFYTRLGLPVTLEVGLELRNLQASEAAEDEGRVLVVNAEIHNVAGGERQVPPVKVTLFDDQRQPIREERVIPPQTSLPEDGMTRIEARVPLPDEGAASYTVSFAPPG